MSGMGRVCWRMVGMVMRMVAREAGQCARPEQLFYRVCYLKLLVMCCIKKLQFTNDVTRNRTCVCPVTVRHANQLSQYESFFI